MQPYPQQPSCAQKSPPERKGHNVREDQHVLAVTVETLRSSEIRPLRICSNVATTSASFDSPSNEPNGPRLYGNRAQACRMARRMRRSWSGGTLLSRAGKVDTFDTRNAKSSHGIAWATEEPNN